MRELLLTLFLSLLFPVLALATNGSSFDEIYYGGRGLPNFLNYLPSAAFGAGLGAFFSEKLREFRRWIFLGLFALMFLAAMLTNQFLGQIAIFFVSAMVTCWLLRETAGPVTGKKGKPTTFGSAEWADLAHLQEHKLIGQEGFSLGFFTEKGVVHPVSYTGARHLLTVAPTRSGKGTSSIIPNLLTYEGSVIVIDPKGENAMISAARRGKGDPERNVPGLGQTVHVVDPWGITGLPVSCFNPLDWLHPQDEDINENAMMLADSIITPQPGNGDQFWDEEAKGLLMGLLLYVALDPREQTQRNMGRVRDILSMGTMKLNVVLEQMMESPNPIVYSASARTTSKEEKLRSNVLAVLQAHTHFLDSPRIRKSLKKSDFKFEDLKTSKMTVYLVLPADRMETFGRWLRLLVQQALTVNARNIAAKPEKPVLFLLDEMASLGRLTMVEQAYSLMAGFGMQLWGIVQDLSQLERIYDKGWETFIGNSGVLQYFGSRDQKTAEYFSKLCGVTTIEKFSIGRTIASAIGSSSSHTFSASGSSTSGSSQTDTYSDTNTLDVVQRNLVYPDELMVLRKNRELVLVENFNPVRAVKLPWYENDALKSLGVNLNERPAPKPERPAKAEKKEKNDKDDKRIKKTWHPNRLKNNRP